MATVLAGFLLSGSLAEMTGSGDLYQVVEASFVAGVVVQAGRIVRAAPILRWAAGKSLEELRRHVEARGGTVTRISTPAPAEE